jgi:cytochrome b subunit of formate dehydrogenase
MHLFVRRAALLTGPRAPRMRAWTALITGMRSATAVICMAAASALLLWQGGVAPSGAQAAEDLSNASCLSCHDGKKKLETKDEEGEERPLLGIAPAKYAKSVHAKMACVACHKDIVDAKAPHQKVDAPKPDCIQCHTALWAAAQKEGKAQEKPRLGVVVKNIEAYKKSFHAKPSKGEKLPRAVCKDCHDTHFFDVPPAGSKARKGAWRLTVPERCAEKCHEDALDDWGDSVHGQLVTEKDDPKGAICIDCHTSHSIAGTGSETFKLTIAGGCGSCHKENYGSYADSYHGKVNELGYSYTAKCYDCHGSHNILKVDNKNSKVYPANRLGTCRQCHSKKEGRHEATAGFATFSPHANTHDFKRYPQMWIAGRFMFALLAGVFIFFWVHSALWYYREYKDRKEGRARAHVRTEELPNVNLAGKQIRRFGPVVRIAHLVFALSVMTLVLTGMAVFYAQTHWAKAVMAAFGGPAVTGIVHRVAAATMLGIFFLHLVYLAIHLWKIRKTFRWFGPDSLVPSWQDLKDIIGMFKWFFGKGPKPLFDRWTYWERFDYWAVFWGMAIIGGSGLMLAFPTYVAAVLPGWTLNVATLVHGEEAFLAAVFLFTVHFFNNHFRPDKLPPPDVVMFTGSMAIEEYRREHPLQYKRLVETGELEKYLVDAPSAPMARGSKALGLVLIAIGLVLLVLVIAGFLRG